MIPERPYLGEKEMQGALQVTTPLVAPVPTTTKMLHKEQRWISLTLQDNLKNMETDSSLTLNI